MTQIPEIGDWLSTAPWRDRAVSLLHLSPDGVRQEHTLDGKRALAGTETGTLIALWTGRYRTDARDVPVPERASVVERLA